MITGSGRSMRNVFEAILFFAFFVLIFIFLPISLKARIILIILTGGPAAFFGLMGIHKCSVIEYIGLLIRYRSQKNECERDDIFKDYDLY